MINTRDVTEKVSDSKDMVVDQTFTDLTKKLNTSGVAFDVVEGLGEAAANSSVVFVNAGGFPNQKIVVVMNYPAPTTAGNEDIGALLRILSFDSPNASYYYARVDAGFAKITRVLNGSFTTLTQQAFALAQGVDVTITFTAVGDLLTAIFDAGGAPATVNLSVSDNQVARRGVMGFRSSSSAVWFRSAAWDQL